MRNKKTRIFLWVLAVIAVIALNMVLLMRFYGYWDEKESDQSYAEETENLMVRKKAAAEEESKVDVDAYESPWITGEYKAIDDPEVMRVSVIQLDDRNFRLFGQKENSIVSYHSDGGLKWTSEDGVRLENASFPFITEVEGGSWRLFFVPTDSVEGQKQVLSATSSDNLNFEKEGGVRFECPEEYDSIESPRVIKLIGDGTYRMYFTAVKGEGKDKESVIMSAKSKDGMVFEQEEGVRINPSEFPLTGISARGAFPIQTQGETWLFFTSSGINGGGIFSATSKDGLNFKINSYPEIKGLGKNVYPENPAVNQIGDDLTMYYGFYRDQDMIVPESAIYSAAMSPD